MADLTTEEIAHFRRLAKAVGARFGMRLLPNELNALLDMAERCAKAEAERNELALHVIRFSTKALTDEA